jgi:predicted dienelactone hydrolase
VDGTADEAVDEIGPFGVGHTTFQLVHTGNAGERRPVDVHVWYPAPPAAVLGHARTTYTSRLHGLPLVPGTYDPLSYSFPARLAHENVAIAPNGPRFPLLIWSHGAGNDALDNAFSVEAITSHGFVVASPQHTNNSQDDGLVDFMNQLAGTTVLACLDALPPPCSGGPLGPDVRNRVRDISAIIDAMEDLNASRFAGRVDVARVGMMGHSRGVMTAIAAVAGNVAQGISVEPRIAAIMTTAAGLLTFDPAELAQVTVPALMMAGALDQNTPEPLVRSFFDRLTNSSRLFLVLREGQHRTFNSTPCARMQGAGAVRLSNARAILEDRTIRGLLVSPANGSTLDYCSFEAFVEPVDIRPLVSEITAVDVTETNVPRLLDAALVSRLSARLAAAFFKAALDRHGSDPLRFPPFLTPDYLLRHEPIVQSAELILRGGAMCPPGLGCTTQ